MRQFKKRTLALVLASVISVAGAFGADNYRNSLKALTFESYNNENVKLVLETSTSYSGNITPVRKDPTTYVIMLPEVNSEASTPDLNSVYNVVSNVNIETMPYTNNGSGYTKITIQTSRPVGFETSNRIYIPSASPAPQISTSQNNEDLERAKDIEEAQEEQEPEEDTSSEQETYNNEDQNSYNDDEEYDESVSDEDLNINLNSAPPAIQDNYGGGESMGIHERLMMILAILLILALSAFFYTKARKKMVEIAGENMRIDLSDSDDNKKEKQSKNKKKRTYSTINNFNKPYSKPVYEKPEEYTPEPDTQEEASVEELNIVDLDEVFKETVQSQAAPKVEEPEEEEENSALEEFLSTFYDEESSESDSTEEEVPDNKEEPEEQYETVELAPADALESELMPLEINDTESIVTEDISEGDAALEVSLSDNFEEVAEDKVLEENLNLKQEEDDKEELYNKVINNDNLKFNKDDISVVNSIMGMEISDEIRRNIKEYAVSVPIKPTKKQILEELMTSYAASQNIIFTDKDVEILNKLIQVEISPDFVTDLRTSSEKTKQMEDEIMARQDEELKKPQEIITLKVADQLPDLADVAAHPELYEDPEPEYQEADPEVLLKNIENVQFKPFYDGSVEFEVLNVFDDEKEEEIIEITKSVRKPGEKPTVKNKPEAQTSAENVQLKTDGIQQSPAKSNSDTQNKLPKTNTGVKDEEYTAYKVPPKNDTGMQRRPIQNPVPNRVQPQRRPLPSIEKPALKPTPAAVKQADVVPEKNIKWVCEGKAYDILSSANLTENIGCHLAKNEDGYYVLSYIGDNINKLKHYPTLKSEKIQGRLSEKLADGTQRFIVRIGIQKFIADVKDGNIKYVMDLC